ncbi:MAG TPA: IS3 family transposase [Alphaproteobacteria bacterium]|nr:IS3 family transposase [Alphaproteobacteria bacterium]
MKRQRSLQVIQRDDELLPRIRALKAEHPFLGYRRIWAYLRYVEQRAVNKKRILRLMREQQLLVTPNLRLKAKRTPTGSKPRPTRPNEWWGIDMTKVLVEGFGWVYIVIVLAWYTKKMVGYYAGTPCTARHWLTAVDMAGQGQFLDGARGHDVSLMSDNGCQPTSKAFMQACRILGIQQAFTSDNNPKGNADTERVMRTVKEECLWLQRWTCPFALVSALDSWITHYNEHDLHSSLGYKPPSQFEQEYYSHHSTPFVAA